MEEQGYGIFDDQQNIMLATQPQADQTVNTTSGNSMEGTWKWSSELTFQLIELRGKYDSWFTGKRGSAQKGWEKIRDELGLSESFDFKVVKKKWQNMLQKYKDLKYPTSNPPQDAEIQEISWPYFAALDKYLRTKNEGFMEIPEKRPKLRKILPRKTPPQAVITEPTVMIQTLPVTLAPPPPPPPQDFCLRWDTYSSNLQCTIPDILKSERFVDVTLACEGKSIKCHKIILSASSPYLDDLLSQNPCQHPIIFMKDVKFSELSAIVEFMYKGEVNVKEDNLQSLLAAAQALQIKGLATNIPGTTTEATSSIEGETKELTQDMFQCVKTVYPPSKRRRNMEVPLEANADNKGVVLTQQPQVAEMQPQIMEVQSQVMELQPQIMEVQSQVMELQPQIMEMQPQVLEVIGNVKTEPTEYENAEGSTPEFGFVIETRSLAQETNADESMQEQYPGESEKSAENVESGTTPVYQMVDNSILDHQSYSPATLMLQAQTNSELSLGSNGAEHVDDGTISPIEIDSSDEADLIVGN